MTMTDRRTPPKELCSAPPSMPLDQQRRADAAVPRAFARTAAEGRAEVRVGGEAQGGGGTRRAGQGRAGRKGPKAGGAAEGR